MTVAADRQFLRSMERLAEGRSLVTADLAVGAIRVRISQTPDLAERLSGALAHGLAAPSGIPAATVLAVTGEPPVRPPWGSGDYLSRDDIRGRTDGPIRAHLRPQSGALSLVDLPARRGLFWCRDAAALPITDAGAPLRLNLHWLLGQLGVRLVHGAVVGTSDGAVLLAGDSGTGKSTTAIAAVAGGLSTVGEDYVALDVRRPDAITAHALYDVAKLGPFGRAAFASVERHPHPTQDTDGKVTFSIAGSFPGRLVSQLPLSAIVLPRVARRTGGLRPVSAVHALRALGPSTTFQFPADDVRLVSQLSTVIRALPAYALDVGPDLDAIPGALVSILDRHAIAA